jgi:hypothetical protein
MEPLALAVVFALALFLILRRPSVFSPVLVLEPCSRWPGPARPGDDEEQLPETDRAPRQWLPWAVGATAALRIALLVVLHT